MSKKFEIKPEKYGFPSNIGGFNIKTITWKDFPAKPPQNTWFLAYTYWNTNYTCITKNGKSKALATVSIGPKAWTRAPQDFRLLQHQTGHYWIACLCALQFQKRVNYTQKQPQGMKFLQWCQQMFKKTSSQFCQEQKRYDKQTYHYLNQEDQQRWKQQMIDKFNQYDKYFQGKRLQQQKQEALEQAKLKQFGRNLNTGNLRTRPSNSLPANKKNTIPTLKPNLSSNENNNIPSNNFKADDRRLPDRKFSVRKAVNHKLSNKNVTTNFQRAKNTILGNIKMLEDLK